ncbi:MAG: DUF2849 domain-containing protein [Alphaproteobacteria bacterium]|nr:DUF2849 domain-containing protein [Alphaproteobacteria bacterium]MDE2162408.1 DUF2849 domain-containing protein [Alphaproteobacteria bacterium]
MAETPRQMLTANRLRDGDVVYWRAGNWVETFGEGDILAGKPEAEAALEAAHKFVADNVVVNPYLFEVQADGTPVKEREIIRAAGPTVRHDLGKQAHGLTPDGVLRAAAARDVVVVPDRSKERGDDVSV